MSRLAAGIRASARLCSLVVAFVFGVRPLGAAAQPAGNLTLDPFRPAIDSRGYLTVNASEPLGHGEISFGLGSLAWGHDLLAFEAGTQTYTIDDVITATLIAAVGVQLGPAELQLGASMPLAILAGDRGPDMRGAPGDANDDVAYRIAGQGLGNIGLHLKTRLLRQRRAPVGLGVIASVYLPTARPADRFLGERTLTPQLLGIVDRGFGRRLRVALNAGLRLRETTTFVDTGDTGDAGDAGDAAAPATMGRITASAEVPYGVGVAYAIAPQKLDLVAELFGALPLGTHERYQPLEALVGIKLYLARSSFLSLGGGRGLRPGQGANPAARAFIGIVFEPNLGDRDGDGLEDAADACPGEPEDRDRFEDDDGCPELDNDRDGLVDEDDRCPAIPEDRDGFEDEDGCPDDDAHDRDGDGLLDHLDRCPDDSEDIDGYADADGCPDPDQDDDGLLDVDDLCPDDAEDRDRFEDEDGCPELDNDHDRILDRDDRCPREPEEYNNFRDADGCPDRHGARLTRTGIVTLEPIHFEYNQAIIKRRSYRILDAVHASLQGNPDLTLVEVAGHTDERGDDAYNLDLSQRRAEAVVRYLVGKGVEARRLEAQGYGETQPLDKAHTERAWATNRRVDFLILRRAGT